MYFPLLYGRPKQSYEKRTQFYFFNDKSQFFKRYN